ncbi:MAG: hypothetical protein AABW65_02855 [Nanoarchaeota archaeon]
MIREASISRREIEDRLAKVGDYVKMDYLQDCLKKKLDFDTKKFVLVKLATIYESRKMYLESGRLIKISADINSTFEGKMRDFIKSAEMYIKGGNFEESDISMTKAIAMANERQKVEIKIKLKELYKAQAKEFLRKDKRKHAMETYEKILTLNLDPLEKKEAQISLLSLYNKLGRIKDSFALQKQISFG